MSNQIEKMQAENDANRLRVRASARVLAEDLRRLAALVEEAAAEEDMARLHDIIPSTFERAEHVRRAAHSVDSLDKLLARVRADGPQS